MNRVAATARTLGFLLLASISMQGCKNYWEDMSDEQRLILIKFFDPEDVQSCHISIESMAYSERISGTFGSIEFPDWAGYVFLDEDSPRVADDPEKGTAIFTIKWRQSTKDDPIFGDSRGRSIAEWPTRTNIKGWIVVGQNDCVDGSVREKRRFILALDTGIPKRWE